MAGNNPFKVLETIGKSVITTAVEELMQNGVLELEEKEKQRYDEAKPIQKIQVLKDCILERRFEVGTALANVFLKGHRSIATSSEITEIQDTPSEPEPMESLDTLNLCPYEKYQKLCKERDGEIYPIKEKESRTRLALIICNTVFDHLSPRLGAERDIAEMKMLLESLDYTVHVEEQLTAKDMKSALQAFAARPEHSTSDSTFLVLMSHGLLEGICGTMHSEDQPDMLPYDTVFSIFNNRNCSRLMDKPKVLIIQACRGVNLGEVKVPDSAAWTDSPMPLLENLQEDAISRTHIEKDFIAFYSSTPHNMSWRDIEMGSPFITQIVTCFQKYAWRLHLEEVFRKVQQSFDKPSIKIQMPTIERQSLTRYFYLFPGH